MQRALLLIYNLLYLFALSILFPFEYLKRPSHIRKRWLKEKLGIFERNFPSEKDKTVWIHAVSVGETVALSGLIRRLSDSYNIVLSTITDTGQAVASERYRDLNLKVIYMPFDLPFTIGKALDFIKPDLVLIAETELWPNFIRICSKRVPVVLINGRLSESSYRGYRRLRFFFKPILNSLRLICVQEPLYRQRFISLGVSEERVRVTGNLKFDIQIERKDFPWESYLRSPIILAGSTHEDEEELILNAFLELRKGGTLIIAPRHPERFERVEKLIRDKISTYRVKFLRLSELSKETIDSSLIVLIDKIGILGSLYRVCDIAVIGGSFIPHGGQNPLEPAYWSKPIVCGPSMENFPFIEDFVRNNACIKTDRANLKEVLLLLIENQELRVSIGTSAHKNFLAKSGATERTIRALEEIIT